MSALLLHVEMGLRLHFRNMMAVVYGYLFPTIFLIAFATLYRYDEVPLVRHVGELLTITVLGGACFGLPTTLVSERERGVWRRYRLAPASMGMLIASTLTTRYILLVIAALLQLGLAMLIGMPAPRHPVELAVAFSCVAFALMGLGLTIAALADTVPAVQALGQCVFLPMLILGGVAVPLASLPPWADRLSKFFPGRYAVDAMAATVTGAGLIDARFSVIALISIGAASCVAGTKMFRWNRGERFLATPGKKWIVVAVAAWALVGIAAETRTAPRDSRAPITPATVASPAGPDADVKTPAVVPPPASATRAPVATDTAHVAPPARKPRQPSAASTAPPAVWSAVTNADIVRDIAFNRLPPDNGIVTPIARPDDAPGDDLAAELNAIARRLPSWPPGQVADRVQRVRNVLAVLATPDVLQEPTERFLPAIVFGHLEQSVPRRELVQILYWIALHADEGSQPSSEELADVGLTRVGAAAEETRNRAAIYAVKLLGRLIGAIG